MYHSTVK
jgi:hypothetical protein